MAGAEHVRHDGDAAEPDDAGAAVVVVATTSRGPLDDARAAALVRLLVGRRSVTEAKPDDAA